ncbi:hypothetical protein HX13_19095 [Chryseobacterium sp. P1-3]|uniref:Lipoprotein n=1 Tax=Chryseobacterium gallinarum TaxID=1324352 RepID=A0A0G3M096_CHRGL|nr:MULTISPECIES: hypothetical protein [Chryseobacterium]AKK72020.1 hypothetical protein OK18_04655 [Chryseobacterium gallinarum]KFF73562.1 hypothetical protein HX13_19095 [Chryseobacterium sp. P1-3]MCL8535594.1 hypothetical protein [Chryseobacterium gallinarum]
MKNFKLLLFCLVLLFSCSKKNSDNTTEKPKPVLIKIGYYPTFHLPAETILNFTDEYLIFYSPVSYNPPLPPSQENGEKWSEEEEKQHLEYLNERPELQPFKIKLSKNDIERIQRISDSFTSEDFNDKDLKPAMDGMSTNIIIVYSNGKLVQINPMNAPNEKQRALYGEILDVLIEKNTNKNDAVILQKIKGYH